MAVTSEKGRAGPRKRTGGKMKATVRRRSAAAAALASPHYRKRVVRSATAYSRKGKGRANEEEGK